MEYVKFNENCFPFDEVHDQLSEAHESWFSEREDVQLVLLKSMDKLVMCVVSSTSTPKNWNAATH